MITTFPEPSIPNTIPKNPISTETSNSSTTTNNQNNTNIHIGNNVTNNHQEHKNTLSNSYIFKWNQNATPIANIVALMFSGQGDTVSISLLAYPELPPGFIQYMYDIINNIWVKGEVPNLVITNKSHYIYYLEGKFILM